MLKLVYVLLLVLLLSLHACCARHLSLTDKKTGKTSHRIGKIDVHGKKHHSSFILTHSEPKVVDKQEKHSSTVRDDESELIVLKKGVEVEISYSKETTQDEGWKRQARSMLGSSPKEAKETMNSKEDDIIDDVVAMDYAQPHRKPPIHNRKL